VTVLRLHVGLPGLRAAGVDLARLEAAPNCHRGCLPDLTVLIDTPLDVANERRAPDVRDRFESADLDFHQRVAAGIGDRGQVGNPGA